MTTLSFDAALVGKGFTSDVFAWGDGRVLKLFHRGTDQAKAEREFQIGRAVYAAGVPAPAIYDLVEVEGRLGIVQERLEGISLFKQVQARPWKLLSAVLELADLHARVHACPAPDGLPSQRLRIASRIDSADLPEADKLAARRCLERLPEGEVLCHGDFHPDNIIHTARGPIIIDWDTATRGHPLGDVAYTSHLFQTADLPSWAPLHVHLLLKFTRSLIHRNYVSRCLQLHGASLVELDVWQIPIAAAARASRAATSRLAHGGT